MEGELKVDSSLFLEPIEGKLYTQYKNIISREYPTYRERLEALFSLKPTLDNYFDTVMVNSEDSEVRKNRQNTISSIYKAFKAIADIKEISSLHDRLKK